MTAPILTPPEALTLRLLAEGLTQPEIAAIRHVSLSTVKSQCQSVYRRLNTPNAHGAVHAAHILGLLPGTAATTADQKIALMREWLVDPEVIRASAPGRDGAS